MKKYFFMLIALLSLTVSAQQLNYNNWEPFNYVDEFGDPIENSGGQRIFCDGVFSNSATHKSDLTVKITDDGENYDLTFYEYDRLPGAKLVYTSTYGTISIKSPAGTVTKVNAFAWDGGGLLVSRKAYVIMQDALVPGCKIYVDTSVFEDYTSSTYLFTYMP